MSDDYISQADTRKKRKDCPTSIFLKIFFAKTSKRSNILTIFSNRVEGKNFRFCPHHPGKNGNSRPGGIPPGQERKFPPGW